MKIHAILSSQLNNRSGSTLSWPFPFHHSTSKSFPTRSGLTNVRSSISVSSLPIKLAIPFWIQILKSRVIQKNCGWDVRGHPNSPLPRQFSCLLQLWPTTILLQLAIFNYNAVTFIFIKKFSATIMLACMQLLQLGLSIYRLFILLILW